MRTPGGRSADPDRHVPLPVDVLRVEGCRVRGRTRGKPHVGCLYNDGDDPDSHWVAIAHERYRYRGHTLTGVASEIVTTMQLQGLGLITAFPEGGPQAFMFGSPPTSCQY